MKSRIGIFVGLMLLLSACGGRQEPTALVSTLPPDEVANAIHITSTNFTKGDCPAQPRFGGTQLEMTCGTLTVPEDRSNPDGTKIELAVSIIQSSGTKTKPDPVLLLMYGPSGEVNFAQFFAFQYEAVNQGRDIIAVDQRGVGQSQPALTCPDMTSGFQKILAVGPYSDQATRLLQDAEQSCYQNWVTQGINLAAYSTDATVADIEDLRQSLGVNQWNIYASGYGAQIALKLMQDYAQTVRSAVIDSVGPLRQPDYLGQAAEIEQVFNQFFEDCALDTKCNQAFPDLKKVFFEVVDQLNANPTMVEVADLNSGSRYSVLVDGSRLMDILLTVVGGGGGGFSGGGVLPEIPRTIYQMKGGSYDNLAKLLGNLTQSLSPSTVGMQTRITCGEVAPLLSIEDLLRSSGQVEEHLRAYFNSRYTQQDAICSVWKDMRTPPAAWPEISASSVPTFIVYGDRNLGSAPAWNEWLATQLSQSFAVEIAGKSGAGGFGRVGSDCQRTMITAFIDDPTSQPDSSCASATPAPPTWITLP